MSILSLIRREPDSRQATRDAMKAVKKAGRRGGPEAEGGPLQKLVESFRGFGLDGHVGFASAQKVADRAARGRTSTKKAVRRIIASHRRGVTAGGFLTGLGGLITLPVLLPANVFEFYVQATRMSGAIAAARGFDIEDDAVRARILATLVGSDAGAVLKNIGLGPVAGAAAREAGKRLSTNQTAQVASAIGGRIIRRFTLRSGQVFGKAIPGLGALIGAWGDRRQLAQIAAAAMAEFPEQPQAKGRKRKG